MELAADVADPLDQRAFDVHVHVFEFLAEHERAGGDLGANLFEPGDDLAGFVGSQHADAAQHAGVGDRAADVLGVESAVEAHALGELLDAGVGRPIKYATPGFMCHVLLPCKKGGQSNVRRDSPARAIGTDTSKRKTFANTFTVNGLERIVNQPRAGAAQEIGSSGRRFALVVGCGVDLRLSDSRAEIDGKS